MTGKLREQVEEMEAACQKLLQTPEEDALTRDTLTRTLAGFVPDISMESAFIRGCSNVVHAQARLLLDDLKAGDAQDVQRSVTRLCQSLADLRKAIDLKLRHPQ